MSSAVRSAFLAAGAVALLALPPTLVTAQSPGSTAYWVYVAGESSDAVSVVRFDGLHAVEEQTIDVGFDGAVTAHAHNIAVSPDGQYWYVSLANDRAAGSIVKMRTGTNELVDSVTLGLLPTSLALTPDGVTLFASDANPGDEARPSVVSAVFTSLMAPVARIETCVRQHGSLVSRDGRNQYSGCLLSDQLVETSTDRLTVTRRMSLTQGREGLSAEGPAAVVRDGGACRPADVVSSRDDGKLYVTCSARGEILEIDRENLRVTRRFLTGGGPYDADITAGGSTLVVTLRGEHAVAVIDLPTGSQERIPTSYPVPGGVAVSPDDRYAFVSNEAAGGGGSVDVIDLFKARLIASAELPYQAGDLAFWKMETGAP